jgi:regulator of sigma E protease
MSIAHPNPIEQVYNSVTSTLKTIGAVASPKSDVRLQHLSGPVGIGRIYYLLFQNERGWQLALWFSVILNVNLAILNMLPIPVLDGGHIVLAIIESVRRKPVNIRVLEAVQTSCAVLIIGYMLYVTFFDVQDLPFIKNRLDKLENQRQSTTTQEP